MAFHDNIRTITLTTTASEPEKDDKIDKETSPKHEAMLNQEDQDSDSSKEDDSLVIKPPQVTERSDKKRSRHSRKLESRRRVHHRSHERSSHRDRTAAVIKGNNRNNVEGRSSSIRVEKNFFRKAELCASTDIREIRINKDVRERDNRHEDSLEEKEMEWRQKRLLFIKKQQKERINPDRPWAKEGGPGLTDLKEIFRKKEWVNQERERRLEKFCISPKEMKDNPPTNLAEKKEKELHVTPETFAEEEPMYYEHNEKEKENTENDSRSETEDENKICEKVKIIFTTLIPETDVVKALSKLGYTDKKMINVVNRIVKFMLRRSSFEKSYARVIKKVVANCSSLKFIEDIFKDILEKIENISVSHVRIHACAVANLLMLQVLPWKFFQHMKIGETSNKENLFCKFVLYELLNEMSIESLKSIITNPCLKNFFSGLVQPIDLKDFVAKRELLKLLGLADLLKPWMDLKSAANF